MQDYLSTKQAAESLSVAKTTLMNWIYSSKVRAERKGRYWYIHQDEVERMRSRGCRP